MRKAFADKLVCPFDKQELDLKVFATDTNEEILEGVFTCKTCRRFYPVIYGLPMMSPDEYRQIELELPMLQRWEKQLKGRLSDGFLLIDDAEELA